MTETPNRPAHTCLVDALAAAQGEIGHANHDRTNPAFKSSYATLAAVREAVRDPLARHGLALTHTIEQGDGYVAVGTALLWGPTERLETSIVIPLAATTAHAVGSAVTYGRRYGVMALLAIAAGEDDDDGQAAVREAPRAAPPPPRQSAPAKETTSAPAKPTAAPAKGAPASSDKPPLPAHVKRLREKALTWGFTDQDIVDAAGEMGCENPRDLTPDQALAIEARWADGGAR